MTDWFDAHCTFSMMWSAPLGSRIRTMVPFSTFAPPESGDERTVPPEILQWFPPSEALPSMSQSTKLQYSACPCMSAAAKPARSVAPFAPHTRLGSEPVMEPPVMRACSPVRPAAQPGTWPG